jgi:hypothetical protein
VSWISKKEQQYNKKVSNFKNCRKVMTSSIKILLEYLNKATKQNNKMTGYPYKTSKYYKEKPNLHSSLNQFKNPNRQKYNS